MTVSLTSISFFHIPECVLVNNSTAGALYLLQVS
jgi:hypothetical protein